MFELQKQSGRARRGGLTTSHGVVQTPVFMPIATKGAVKTLSSDDLRLLGAEMILSNTYHLMLRPGLESMKKLGGFHALTGWDRALLTDSGGYQVFSLSTLNKISENGVAFSSPIDGAKHVLTPELSIEMQFAIGADIMMQFDDVAAGDSPRGRYEEAMERSLRWAARCKETFLSLRAQALCPPLAGSNLSLLFGIVQGGTHEDLRERSAKELVKIGFDGYAIGGLSVGEKRADTFRVAKHTAALLPEEAPRYFMGGGFPEEIVYYVSVGIDMFDCVLPTRNARHGTVFVWKDDPSVCVAKALALAQEGATDPQIAAVLYDQVHLTNEKYTHDLSMFPAFDRHLETVNKAYLRHLFMTAEPLGQRLATMHNLAFYLRLMHELRQII